MVKPLSLISYACGKGAQLESCAAGPSSLKRWGLADRLQTGGTKCRWEKAVASSEGDDLQVVTDACQSLYTQVIATLSNDRFPVTLGGDHSMAVGTWSAVADYYEAKQRLGLIWVDAHLDAHTPRSSPSGAIHGMPAANLLGYGHNELINVGSVGVKIAPEHLVYIGIRSYEQGEYDLLRELGVQIYTMHDVIKEGFENTFQDALKLVRNNADGFGLTVDLDAFDPTRAPGVGSPEGNGLLRGEVFAGLKSIGNHESIRALEIAEYNPAEGHGDITKELVFELMTAVFA